MESFQMRLQWKILNAKWTDKAYNEYVFLGELGTQKIL